MRAVSGEQVTLRTRGRAGEVRAEIATLAAALRVLRVGEDDLVEPYSETQLPPKGAGLVLAPWPNRVRAGAWTLNGARQQLDLTEPDRGNAIHGLLRNTAYQIASLESDRVRLVATIHPQHGWPFLIETSVNYTLTDDGIDVQHVLVNRSTQQAPLAVGAHPYVRVGDRALEDAVISAPISGVYDVDNVMIPVGVRSVDDAAVAATTLDLRAGVRIGDADLDTGFRLGSPNDGEWFATRVRASDGAAVVLRQDRGMRYLQVYTPRPFSASRPLALAVEPMSAAADALNSGDGLRWVGPNEQLTARWSLRFEGPTP